jgi:hypothetical protein
MSIAIEAAVGSSYQALQKIPAMAVCQLDLTLRMLLLQAMI